MDPVTYIISLIGGVTPWVVGQAFLAANIGFALTVAGALPALLGMRAGDAVMSYGMGFAAGVMISASFTSLLIPAEEVGGIIPVFTGFILGALATHVMNELLPHEHLVRGYEGPEKLRRRLRAAWLLVFAITIHNIPEGAAVGAAVAGSLRDGVILAIAIGIQNVPEGLAVALPLITAGKRTRLAMGLAVLSGAVEPVAAAGAAAVIALSKALLPYMLSFAAGAMMYVVSHEIIPETHEGGREIRATAGLIIGLIIMFSLDAYYR